MDCFNKLSHKVGHHIIKIKNASARAFAVKKYFINECISHRILSIYLKFQRNISHKFCNISWKFCEIWLKTFLISMKKHFKKNGLKNKLFLSKY